uniref:Ribonuclease A-domain domain-containing protein n=1 Tax=Neogobius melanostomus TaxID=47308 RepID=A0A8C6SHI0_9GOBI
TDWIQPILTVRENTERQEDKFDCTEFMKTVNVFTGQLREDNTVIITTSPNDVKNICMDGTRAKPKKPYTSEGTFKVILCGFKIGGAEVDSWKYNTGPAENKHITVKCDNGLPYHFVGVN